MKILMMHKGDGGLGGGGQVQMRLLCAEFRKRGVDARALCRQRSSEDSVLMPYRPRAERWLGRFTKRVGLNDIHLISSARVPKLAEFHDADLVDVHCLHSETFSYLSMPALTADKPAVFTFHDMWPITGHCHASLECERWKTGCGHCPHLDIYPEVRRDATAIEWKLKKRAYGRSRFTIVTPSKWLLERTKESMLGSFAAHHIPHGIDTEVFQPLDKEHCRAMLGIPKDKHVLVCGMESMQRPLKGADLLVKALGMLPDALKRESVLLLFGNSNEKIIREIGMRTVNLGYLHNSRLKAMAFSAADLFVNPTRAEAFGLVVLESIACGTPVVSFGVGGVPELVRPGLTGYVARPESPADLAEGVVTLLGDNQAIESMSGRCREIVEAEYSLELQVERYLQLYEEVIRERQNN